MRMTPYWLDTATPFASGVQDSPGGTADVAVVGAGFTGLSAALALAKKGAKVVVLEAGRVANAASGRNGGMCNNGFAQDYLRDVVERLGYERANMLYRAFDAGVDKVEAIVTEERIDCDFERVGKLKLAAKPDALRQARPLAGTAGARRSIRTRAWCRARKCTTRSVLIAISAVCSSRKAPACTWEGTARVSPKPRRDRGALIYENNPVIGLRRVAGQVHEVTTPHGSVRATPGAAGHRHVGRRPARLVPSSHRAGGRLYHRDGTAAGRRCSID